jgi:hypothetical protein
MIDKAHAYWSLGTYFFWPVFAIGVLLILLGIIGALFARDSDLAWAGVLPGVIIVVIASACYWPVFDSSYHKWYPVNGTVLSTSSRLLSNGNNGVNQRIVVRFTESDELFGCDDSRCTALITGSRLNLKCKRDWQFQGTSGWACVYVDAR